METQRPGRVKWHWEQVTSIPSRHLGDTDSWSDENGVWSDRSQQSLSQLSEHRILSETVCERHTRPAWGAGGHTAYGVVAGLCFPSCSAKGHGRLWGLLDSWAKHCREVRPWTPGHAAQCRLALLYSDPSLLVIWNYKVLTFVPVVTSNTRTCLQSTRLGNFFS